MFEYLTDGNEIYRQSFALIRAEADLGAFTPDQAQVAVRMIHAAGQTDLARDIEFSPHLVTAARMALAAGKPILTDVFMVHSGITRTRLPHNNEALCFLRDNRVPGLAKQLGTTLHRRRRGTVGTPPRWRGGGYRQRPHRPVSPPELVTGGPGPPPPRRYPRHPRGIRWAAESKQALASAATAVGTEFLTVHGRRGGSAITCAAINALATEKEILEQP